MVFLLVVLTFLIFLSAGFYLEYRERAAREARESGSMLVAEPVFAQDGGEPVEEEQANQDPEAGSK